ncbi:ABC transporter ATP-binding protein [Candidatus Bipolaricaulota bacterium]
MTDNILDVHDLHVRFKVYEGILHVLDGVRLHVRRGSQVGLAGETGCGKSVLVKTIMGILRSPPAIFAGGPVSIDGMDVLTLSAKDLLRIKGRVVSMIFQDPMNALNPVFTVGSLLQDVIRFADRRSGSNASRPLRKAEIRRKAIKILSEARLPDPPRIMRSYSFELSGGMRQRVLIAMALVNEPRLLLADEPGTALDVSIQAQILHLLKELVEDRGISVLLITHNLGVIRETMEQVYIMYAGQIVEMAPVNPFFERPVHPYSRGLLESIPHLSGRRLAEGIPGTVPDYVEAPTGCRFHPRCSYAVKLCEEERPAMIQVEADRNVACVLARSEAQ